MDKNVAEELKRMLWAKSDPFKPLLVHLVEVGTVAQSLLNDSVFFPILLELCKRTSLPKEQVTALVGYLAAVHDIGKIHPSFVGSGAIPEVQKYLEDNQLHYNVDHFRHEKYGAYRLKTIWEGKKRFQNKRLIRSLTAVIRYHHQGKRGETGRMSSENEAVWKVLQEDYEELLFQYFRPPDMLNVTHVDAFCMSLLGIVVASDWIASGEEFASTPTDLDIDKIIDNAARLTNEFIIKNQMVHREAFDGIFYFTDLWDFIPRDGMRPLQTEAEKAFADTSEKPLAVIVEAPMGEGKTEAAMYMATQLAKRWQKEGFYVALPTAATSNQMYSRINAMLNHLQLEKSKLMHAMAWLVDYSSSNNFTGETAQDAKLWTAPMRRGLISPFAVGTIDQAMMSVMRTKYGVLRLSGLEQKVLVIDELHSYDAYMSAIIEMLLKWCAALHVPVIMLSATLPAVKKQAFASCYLDNVTVIRKGLYPALTFLYEDRPLKQVAVYGSHQKINIKIDNEPWIDNLAALVRSVKERIYKYGGCYCIIRNTVREAQDTYAALKQEIPDIPMFLFHARFSAERRQELERKCTECFGSKKDKRPEKLILVATQVVEQSLDLDFDYLVTDICPVDLLLQRAGRLWRHEETPRPDGIEPELTVLNPGDNDYGASGLVYADAVLDRTREVLKDKNAMFLPDDIPDMVEQVYDEEKLNSAGLEKWIKYKTDENLKQSAATIQILDEPDEKRFYYSESDDIFFSDDEEKFLSVKTRLGEPNVKLALLPHDLFIQAGNDKVSLKTVEKVLMRSVSVAEKKVSFLYSCKDDSKIMKGTGLLNGIWMLDAENDVCTLQNGHTVIMDNDIGLMIEGGKNEV